MSALLDFYLKEETLQTLLKTVQAKGEKGVSITVSLSDETNKFGQNVSGYVSQTKEQREAKADKYYVGNGKVFWTDGKVTVAVKKEEVVTATSLNLGDTSGLPF